MSWRYENRSIFAQNQSGSLWWYLPRDLPCWACCSSVFWQRGTRPQSAGAAASHTQYWLHRKSHFVHLHSYRERVNECKRAREKKEIACLADAFIPETGEHLKVKDPTLAAWRCWDLNTQNSDQWRTFRLEKAKINEAFLNNQQDVGLENAARCLCNLPTSYVWWPLDGALLPLIHCCCSIPQSSDSVS